MMWRRILKRIGVAVCALVLAGGISYASTWALYGSHRASVFGFKALKVVSGSMEPLLYAGDYLVIRLGSWDELAEGDVIAYEHEWEGEEILILHRIYEKADHAAITKGDANSRRDPWIVLRQDYVGKMILPLE